MSELEIPERAFRAADELPPHVYEMRSAIKAAAPIIVATKLRELADDYFEYTADDLRAVADELDPPASLVV